jgi:DNA-binding transcriptional LysR family regulator
MAMDYRISDLKNFERAAHFNTISEGAKSLGMTQPSLSQSIKRLEKDLGAILFYRTKKGVALTPDGKFVFIEAKKVLTSLEMIKSSSSEGDSFLGRSITIGCHSTVGAYTLPFALSELKLKCENFKFDIIHGSSRYIQEQVQNGKVDLGLVINPNKVPDIIIKEVASDAIYIWSKTADTIDLDKVICNFDIYQTQSILKKWKKSSFDLINSESFDLVIRLTEKNIGYGIIPERAVNLTGIKLYKHTDLPSFKDSICLVYRPEFGKRPYEKQLIDSITKALM